MPPTKVDFSSLTKTDTSRLLVVLMCSDIAKTDWDKAGNLYGSTSINGFKVCYADSRKKIRALIEAAENGTAAPDTYADTPAMAAKKPRGRKRKSDGDTELEQAKGVNNASGAKRAKKSGKNAGDSLGEVAETVEIKKEAEDTGPTVDSTTNADFI